MNDRSQRGTTGAGLARTLARLILSFVRSASTRLSRPAPAGLGGLASIRPGFTGSAIGMCVMLLTVLFVPAAWATGIEEADKAFDDGDNAKALELYEEVLNAEPGNVQALVRSGMLLSWDKKYDEAVKRYDRALAIEPGNVTAAHERAKVLSWSKRYEDAETAFRSLLARDPKDRDARLGLARTLSWGGDQGAARAEYETLLAADPNDPDALLGVAQTLAWSSDAREAYPAFHRALEAKPDMKEAELGLAYLDLASGDRKSATARAEDLDRRYPGDAEVQELKRAARRAQAPWVLAGYERMDDSDRNSMNVFRVEGGLGLGANLDFRAGAARYDIFNASADGHIDSIWGVLGSRIGPRQRLEARAGADRSVDTGGFHRTDMIGGLAWSWGLGGDWTGLVSAERDTVRYSVAILDSRILVDAYTATVDGPIGKRFHVGAIGTYWDLSDTNNRRGFEPGVWYRWPLVRTRLETGYVFRWFDFEQNLQHGYFDPDNYRAHVLQLRASRTWGKRSNTWDVLAELGLQSYSQREVGQTIDVTNDRLASLSVNAGFPLAHGMTLEAYGSIGDYNYSGSVGPEVPAPPSSAGSKGRFRVRQGGVRLRFDLGGK